MTTVPTPGPGQLLSSWYSNVDHDAHYVLSTFQDSAHPTETPAQFEARHADAVAARKVTYPPDYQ